MCTAYNAKHTTILAYDLLHHYTCGSTLKFCPGCGPGHGICTEKVQHKYDNNPGTENKFTYRNI